jgi:hypothetical protein
VKKLILLTLALVLLSFAAVATAHPPTPYCSCSFCAENDWRACEDEGTGDIYTFCSEYTELFCTP